jgi:hypothetical protein
MGSKGWRRIKGAAEEERKIIAEKSLTNACFVVQSMNVDRHAASQHLEVIRTLMERSAVYRRALAPTMVMLGLLGIVAGLAGYYLQIVDRSRFAFFWMGVGVAGLAGAYLQMRGQALKEREPFWSPPTKRVTLALTPALFVGAMFGLAAAQAPMLNYFISPSLIVGEAGWWLPAVWMLLYGCAIHAAGFFMPRGFKLFGWSYILAGCFVWAVLSRLDHVPLNLAHLLMAVVFGGPHLAYGLYLAITEKRREEV